MWIEFRFSEKATKFEKISHLFWRYWVKTTLLSKQVGYFFNFCGLLIIAELYKSLVFCRNNGWIMENMDKGLTVPKWVLINLLGVRSPWNGGRVRLCLSSLPLVTMYPHWVDILYKVQTLKKEILDWTLVFLVNIISIVFQDFVPSSQKFFPCLNSIREYTWILHEKQMNQNVNNPTKIISTHNIVLTAAFVLLRLTSSTLLSI